VYQDVNGPAARVADLKTQGANKISEHRADEMLDRFSTERTLYVR